MKQVEKINEEISKLTSKIEHDYPELYEHLSENPITIPQGDNEDLEAENLAEYLDSLKQMLDKYIERKE